jgi:hypothetical protein
MRGFDGSCPAEAGPTIFAHVRRHATQPWPTPRNPCRMTTPELTCFKAYDVRGRIPDELNPDIAYRIGRAYAAVVRAAPRGRRPRHPPEQRADLRRAGRGPARRRYRRARHRPVRHRGDLLRHLRPGRRRRHRGHRQPQPEGLQRDEVRARGFAPDQQRLRAARDQGPGRRRTTFAPAGARGSAAAASMRARATSRTCWAMWIAPR